MAQNQIATVKRSTRVTHVMSRISLYQSISEQHHAVIFPESGIDHQMWILGLEHRTLGLDTLGCQMRFERVFSTIKLGLHVQPCAQLQTWVRNIWASRSSTHSDVYHYIDHSRPTEEELFCDRTPGTNPQKLERRTPRLLEYNGQH